MTLIYTAWLIASVLVLSQPSVQSSIEVVLQSGPVSVSGLAELVCTVTGDVAVHNFTWYHNGVLRLERTRPYISIQYNGNVSTLAMHDVTIEEAGNYTCVAHASNTSTPLQHSIILRLQVPPQVTAEPDQFVLLGNDATITCNVTGDPTPRVLWGRHGEVIDVEDSMRHSVPKLGLLKITNASLEDAGLYECRASNVKGSDLINITLTVLTMPVIQSQSSIVTEAGQQTTLHCDATGIDTPTISWRSGGMEVGRSNGSRLTSYANGSLVINDTEVLDSGRYSCLATNKAGSTSFSITLNVTGTPVLLVPPENKLVKVGDTATLSCSFLANPNDGGIQWEWRGESLPSTSDKYNIFPNGTLIIRETTDDDSGEYQCIVTNSKGNMTAKANLIVINQPNTPDNFQRVGSASTQTFTVSWSAPRQSDTTRPVGSYLFILRLVSDEQQINSTIRVPNNQTQYTFTDLLPGSQYEVLIAAYNQVGTSNYSESLTINTIPTVPALEYFIVTESETDEARLIFMWRVKYDGGHVIDNFVIQYRDVQDASEDGTWMDLFARGLDESMETYKPESLPPPGNYIFRALIGNVLGDNFYNHSTGIDIPEAIPGQPSKPEASEITTDSVTLDFNITFMGTGMVKQFVLRVMGDSEETRRFPADDRFNSSSNVTVTVDGLEADSTYMFQVAAMNDIGIGPYSETSDPVTTEKDETFVYIIVGAVGGFVIIVIILLVTLVVCYLCNKRMKAHKHQKTEVPVAKDDATDHSNGFISQYDKPLRKFTPYNSDSTILSPIERSRSLQYRNENFGPSAGSTISYSSSVATRTASLLHTKPNNYVPRGQMYNSMTVIGYGGGSQGSQGSQFTTMDNRRWSPPMDLSQRERRSPSSTYHSDSMGRITNMATDV